MDTSSQMRASLQSRRGDWPTLCKATGLSYWWVTKFAQGRIREPGLSKIERLQRYIADNPLPAAADAQQAEQAAPVKGAA